MKKIWDLLVVAPCAGDILRTNSGIHTALVLSEDLPSAPGLAADEPAARSLKLGIGKLGVANLGKGRDFGSVLEMGSCSDHLVAGLEVVWNLFQERRASVADRDLGSYLFRGHLWQDTHLCL